MSSLFYYPQEIPLEQMDRLAELLRDDESSPWEAIKTASMCVGCLAEYYEGWEIPDPVPGVACESLSRLQLADEIDRYAVMASGLLADGETHDRGSPDLIRGLLPLLSWVIESMIVSKGL